MNVDILCQLIYNIYIRKSTKWYKLYEFSAICSSKERKLIMKSTGIVRKVDDLGRIVLPIELRRTLDINERDSLEIFVDGSQIILKKYLPSCIFCGEADNLRDFRGKLICADCVAGILDK